MRRSLYLYALAQGRAVSRDEAAAAVGIRRGLAAFHLDRLADDGMVEVIVNDSGPGIDPAIRNRLFEPLVTTKVKGVGLGLSLSRRILERNEGTIALGQGPLSGAAFVIRLPLHVES